MRDACARSALCPCIPDVPDSWSCARVFGVNFLNERKRKKKILLSFVVVFLEMLKGHFTSVELFLLQSTVVAEGIGLLRDQNFTG